MINEELEKNYNQKIKELAMKNKDINKVSSRIFEYEQEIKEIKKQIENENQIDSNFEFDYLEQYEQFVLYCY